mgnify:CR=1 FL=1|tara:strand:- start:1864 stop:2361 length:498 start_codon:yes stop_codon:yes gene_type:complete
MDFHTFPWLKDIEKNLIHDLSDAVTYSDHEENILREELSITHKVYKKEIDELKNIIDLKDMKITELFDRMIALELIKDKMDESFDELNLKCSLLIKSREDWLGRSLKLHYLFQEMDKIGLKQSEDIFEAYKDIEMPINEIPIQIRERYIPTILTNTVELESTESD